MGLATADRARAAVRLAESDPQEAIRLAETAVRDALALRDLSVVAVGERALGLAALQLQDMGTALRHLRRAVRVGRRAGADAITAEARMTLAGVLNRIGQPRAALREIEEARAVLTGADQARATGQRGAILHQLGRLDEAVESYREALPGLRRADDIVWLQRTLGNRGVLHAQRQEFAAAAEDLLAAKRLCEEGGLQLSAGYVHQNLGFVYACRGDAPTALGYFDLAETCFRQLGSPLGELLVDRAELLLSVRLISEAREAAEAAIADLERDGQALTLPEARLVLSRAALLDGRVVEATQQAQTAIVEFNRQDRAEWTALGKVVLLSCLLAHPGQPRTPTTQIERLATLVAKSWPGAAVYARLTAARLAIRRGQRDKSRRLLGQAAAARSHGPVTDRALAWHAEALIRLTGDDRSGALRAARAGLRTLDDHVAALGATDLRASAAGHRTDLATLGLRIAIEGNRAVQIFQWAELGRASHLSRPPVRPYTDPELADVVADLRATVRKIRESRRDGRVDGRLRSRQVVLERTIRDLQRKQSSSTERSLLKPPSIGLVRETLRDAALVEFVQCDQTLYVLTIVAGRIRFRTLVPLQTVADLVDRLLFALRGLGRQRADKESRTAALALLRYAAGELSRLLFGATPEIGDRPLAVIPTGFLQSLPWALLPACVGRPVCVAPSAALLCVGPGGDTYSDSAIVAAGPGLPGSRDEAIAVAALYGVKPLLDGDAEVAKITRALDGARMAHLAAHGDLRVDNPLFSAVHLSDGPLMAYDLERLRRAPRTVVLAACDTGQSVVRAGDEIMGFAATLLASGTRQLIAPVVAIPDVETAPVMAAFHRLVLAGDSPANALAAIPAAASFVCLGNGFEADEAGEDG